MPYDFNWKADELMFIWSQCNLWWRRALQDHCYRGRTGDRGTRGSDYGQASIFLSQLSGASYISFVEQARRDDAS